MQKILLFILLFTSIAFQGKAQNFASIYPSPFPQQMTAPSEAATAPENTTDFVAETAVEQEAFEFSTSYTGSGNLLKWDVPHEKAVVNVIIEGSADGQHFIDLESLEHTEAEAMDLFYDAAPQGRRYYQIIANYKDGTQRVTPISLVAGVPEKPMSVALTTEGADVLLVETRQRIELYNMQGQLLKTADPQNGRFVLDMELLPHGQYLVRAGDDRRLITYL